MSTPLPLPVAVDRRIAAPLACRQPADGRGRRPLTWQKLLDDDRVVADVASEAELRNLGELMERCLADARVPALSPEGRFVFAYDAVRTGTLRLIRAAGYRPTTHVHGGHQNLFLALGAVDHEFRELTKYFQACRKLRNELEYRGTGGVPPGALADLLRIAGAFHEAVCAYPAARPALPAGELAAA